MRKALGAYGSRRFASRTLRFSSFLRFASGIALIEADSDLLCAK